MSDFVTLCGLWKNTDKSKNYSASGSLGFSKIFIFPNKNKQSDKSPDFFVKVVEPSSNGNGQREPGEDDLPI